MKTYSKLEIPFWDYLGDRLKVPDAPAVPDLARQKIRPGLTAPAFAPLTASIRNTKLQ